jgi:hypothetical protein
MLNTHTNSSQLIAGINKTGAKALSKFAIFSLPVSKTVATPFKSVCAIGAAWETHGQPKFMAFGQTAVRHTVSALL